MKQKALITGATAGFGKATAELFAQNGHDIIITGRREERLKELKESLETEHGVKVKTLCFDVRNEADVKSQIGSLEGDWAKVGILINNAGLASGLDTIQDGDSEDWDKMIDTNVKGLLYVSKAVIPGLIERKEGHIINI